MIDQAIVEKVLNTSQGKNAYSVVETLTDAGHRAWWVGGSVRDMGQGIVPDDIDIATSALPTEVVKLFPEYDDTAAKLGSVIIYKGIDNFEVTTFRQDDEISDGRHPEKVIFGSLEEDVKRRDFTINAVYYHPISREIYDPAGGLNDLTEKLIRFIGEPGMRISHDVLRMLRAIRFRALINGQYHPDTFKALHDNARKIESLSGTRRLIEFAKMVMGPNADRALEDLWETDILEYMIPQLHACKGVAQPKDFHHEGDVWDHMMKIARSWNDEHGLDVRLASLFHDCGKAVTFSVSERIRFDEHASISGDLAVAALKKLQCPRKRIDKINWLIRHHMILGDLLIINEKRKRHWYFHPWFNELLQLFWLDIAGTEPSVYSLYNKVLKDYHYFLDTHPRPRKPLLSGDEVMKFLGLKSGPEIGEIMQQLHDLQYKRKITTKKEAIEYLEKKIVNLKF